MLPLPPDTPTHPPTLCLESEPTGNNVTYIYVQYLRSKVSKSLSISLYAKHEIITIDVPLFKNLRDIIFFWWDNHFMSHFEGHFEGAKTFLTP